MGRTTERLEAKDNTDESRSASALMEMCAPKKAKPS
jgi:hypothetical protein